MRLRPPRDPVSVSGMRSTLVISPAVQSVTLLTSATFLSASTICRSPLPKPKMRLRLHYASVVPPAAWALARRLIVFAAFLLLVTACCRLYLDAHLRWMIVREYENRRHSWRRSIVMRDCREFHKPDTFLVYSEVSSDVDSCRSMKGYVLAQRWNSGDISQRFIAYATPIINDSITLGIDGSELSGSAELGGSLASTLFLHERVTSGGVRRIAYVRYVRVRYIVSLWSEGWGVADIVQCATLEEAAENGGGAWRICRSQASLGGRPTFDPFVDGAGAEAPRAPRRIYAGQADVSDSSHFSIKIESGGMEKTIDGWLKDAPDGASTPFVELRGGFPRHVAK